MTQQLTTKANIHLQRHSFIALLIILLGLITACSEDTGKQEISQKIEPPVKKDIAIAPKTQSASPVIEEKLTEIPATKPTTATQNELSNTSENTVNENQTDIEKKISQLESSLKDKKQHNATLRQHMEVLLKKVQENQNLIEELEKSSTNNSQK